MLSWTSFTIYHTQSHGHWEEVRFTNYLLVAIRSMIFLYAKLRNQVCTDAATAVGSLCRK